MYIKGNWGAIGLLWLGLGMDAEAQPLRMRVHDRDKLLPVPGASIVSEGGRLLGMTDSLGRFGLNEYAGNSIRVTAIGYLEQPVKISGNARELQIALTPNPQSMNEVVVTGTMKLVQRSVSPVPVEVYSPGFFRKNPTPSLFEALQMVNGVRPQLNCNVCNTGDIHMNGLEGPYTLLLIDGMPIVSSLSTVYGLSGIPQSLVERVEVIKGPASSLYGAEAIGGLINVITQNPLKAPAFALDLTVSSWQEATADLGVKYRPGPGITALLGASYFRYDRPIDQSADGFTDVTLQHRLSVFNKYAFRRKAGREAALALRYVYEDRWGGDMRWTLDFRGTDSIYGESIYTSRLEAIGRYALPISEKIVLNYSFNQHVQRSVYGIRHFDAQQSVAFAQLTWDKQWGTHDALLGLAYRRTQYDDNTVATRDSLSKESIPERTDLPGMFIQDEWKLGEKQRLLTGLRWDHHPVHGNIFTPRLAWKLDLYQGASLRVNAGTGFRVVHLFTEDHAALTGARTVVIRHTLKPERSVNLNLHFSQKWASSDFWVNLDASAWLTRFSNRIQPDYSNPSFIIYDNLAGYAISKGVSLNADFGFTGGLRGNAGLTMMNLKTVTRQPDGSLLRERPMLSEKWSATWLLSYAFAGGWSVDYTGNLCGPMRLPLASEKDPRPANSPVWSIQNIQVTRKFNRSWDLFAGVKNLLNWTPARHSPFLIARSGDPFNKELQYDGNGQVIPSAGNPYGLRFDTNYTYAPNQGIRLFLGARFRVSSGTK